VFIRRKPNTLLSVECQFSAIESLHKRRPSFIYWNVGAAAGAGLGVGAGGMRFACGSIA
jgi:hypothetical protein